MERPRPRVLIEAIEIVENKLKLLTQSELEALRLDSKPRKLNVSPLATREFERSLGQHLIGDKLLRSFEASAEPDSKTPVQSSVLKAFRKRKVIKTRPGTRRPILEQVALTGAQVACAYEFAEKVEDTYVQKNNKNSHGLIVSFAEGLVRDFSTAPIVVSRNPLVRLASRIKNKTR